MKKVARKRRRPIGSTTTRKASSTARPSNITELRKAKGYHSQKEFAEELGVSTSLLCYWENSFFMPSSPNIKKLCDVLECTVDELFDWRS